MRNPPQGAGLAASVMAWLGEVARAISDLQVPQAPQGAYPATSTAPPLPVTDFQGKWLWWSDLKTFGYCDGKNWFRADTGGVVV